MKFVKKKSSGLSFKSFVHAVAATNRSRESIRDLFRKWCESKGGEYEEEPYGQYCVFESEHGYLEEDVVRDFHNFVSQHKSLLDKLEGWSNDMAISTENKLIGGYTEGVTVEYSPSEREFKIYAHFYSDFGQLGEPAYEKIPVKKQVKGVLPYSVEQGLENNEATWEWMGYADVWASVPFHEISAHKLAVATNEAVSLASKLANEALEEFLEIPEEEEAW